MSGTIDGKAAPALDTNVLISIIDGRDPLTRSQFAFLQRLEDGKALAATSEVTLAECLIKPYGYNDGPLVARYLVFLQNRPELAVVPVSRDILIRAAMHRAMSRIKLPDAILLATAEFAGCTIFLSEDRRIRPVKPIRLAK
jgi:predicted nucleic acid-binding protein